MKDLIEYFGSMPSGSIQDTSNLEALLANCWHEFTGYDSERMTGYKLYGRMEDVIWNKPILSFTIERHGITVVGSSRAEIQKWELNIQDRIATCFGAIGYRQIYPMQSRLNVKPIAEDIANLIASHQNDERLKWYSVDRVQILIGMILTNKSACKQTLTNRRKRLRENVRKLLNNLGWKEVRANVFCRLNN